MSEAWTPTRTLIQRATLALIADVDQCHLREVAFFGDFAPHPRRGKVGESNQCK